MIFADLVFDVVSNLSRFFIMFELLEIGYGAISAATIASIIAACLSYLAINVIFRKIHVFGSKKQS